MVTTVGLVIVSELVSIVAGSPAVIRTEELLADHVTPELMSTAPETPDTSAVASTVSESPIMAVVGVKMSVKLVPFSTHTVAVEVALTPSYSAVIVAGVELRSLPVSTPDPLTATAPLLLDQETLPVIFPADVVSVLVP
jgi:hypothetical protein